VPGLVDVGHVASPTRRTTILELQERNKSEDEGDAVGVLTTEAEIDPVAVDDGDAVELCVPDGVDVEVMCPVGVGFGDSTVPMLPESNPDVKRRSLDMYVSFETESMNVGTRSALGAPAVTFAKYCSTAVALFASSDATPSVMIVFCSPGKAT